MTLQEVRQRLQDGETTTGQKIPHFGANLRGTSQYRAQHQKELGSFIQYQKNEGSVLPLSLPLATVRVITLSQCVVYLNCTMYLRLARV